MGAHKNRSSRAMAADPVERIVKISRTRASCARSRGAASLPLSYFSVLVHSLLSRALAISTRTYKS